jgi:hypothetical protein
VNRQDFLSAALPGAGHYCVAGIRDNRVRQTYASTIEEIDDVVEALLAEHYDLYLAYATFSAKERSQANAMLMKSFWLDIDCGQDKSAKGKGYASQADGIQALIEFCKATGLPKPAINNSGRGLHVFWVLDAPITKDEWSPVAGRLKAACRRYGLIADPAVTADQARILRIPDTLNFKDPAAPKRVHTICMGNTMTFSEFKGILDNLDVPESPALKSLGSAFSNIKREFDPVTQSLLTNNINKFSTIARRSISGTGCNQIKYIITHQADVEEPLWRAGLSIAWHCTDGETAIHKMSNKHPDYTPDNTIEKAKLTKGPYLCSTFREINPDTCKGCKRKMSSPIQLGKEVQERDHPVPVEIAPDAGIAENAEDMIEEPDDVIDSLQTYKPPFPYFRGKNGGLYRRGIDEDDPDRLIYEYDIYVTKRIDDPIEGMCAEINLHTPVDGHRRFVTPCSHINSMDKFRDVMSRNGVMANKKGMDDLMQYHIDYVKELQRRGQSPDQARLQFGWMDKDSKFIIGNREVGPRKTGYSPASSATLNIVNYYEPKGTLAGWKRSFNLLVGDENSPQAFAIMSTFGSPLVKFSGIKGALISLVNNRSGTGKTTILKLINSVWGHPEETMLQKEDTYMSKQNRLGVLNNMPATIDEITNMRPEDVSDMAYAITLGRGRNRMEAAVNRERLNTTRWALIAVATGNSFLSDKLGALKATADGELMRLIEIEIDLAENPEATELLDSLSENYGLAGETYIRYIVNNRNEVSRSIDKMRERIIRDTGAQRKERYWVNVVAVNIVGGIIAQKLGLHDYNMRAIYKWAISYFSNMRSVAETHVVETEHILGEFLNENISSYLVVDKSKINPVTGSHVVKPVQHRVIVRYEIDTKLMFIAKKEFKEYCVSRQINVDNAVKECSHDYTYRGLSKKRLTAGTGVTSPPVEVYTFYAPIQPSDLDAQDRLNEL